MIFFVLLLILLSSHTLSFFAVTKWRALRALYSSDPAYSMSLDFSVPVFSRLLHVSKIPYGQTVTCRIRANETERLALAREFDVDGIRSFTANVTARYQDPKTILLRGIWKVEAQLIDILDAPDVFSEEFDMTWLNNYKVKDPVEYEYKKWDDEVPLSGNIDIGGVVMQDFSMNFDAD